MCWAMARLEQFHLSPSSAIPITPHGDPTVDRLRCHGVAGCADRSGGGLSAGTDAMRGRPSGAQRWTWRAMVWLWLIIVVNNHGFGG